MLKELLHERAERQQTIAECQSDIRRIEAKVVDQLIVNKWFHLFSVNWRKLERASRTGDLG